MSLSALQTRWRTGSYSRAFARRLATHAPKKPQIAVAVLLNRAPTITRTPSKFEQVFYKYQARIQRALHNPFPYDFYFKPGSVLEAQFNAEEKARERRAFGKNFLAEDGKDDSKIIETGEEDETPASRRTAADESNDIKSLDRLGARNLYLLVRGSPEDKYEWRFPMGGVEAGEVLHEAARRQLHLQCGPNMNTWIVGRRPVGLLAEVPTSNEDTNKKVFFFKGHIFAGQAQPQKDFTLDFAWLTKEEIESRVSTEYWQSIKDMLSDS